MIPQAHLAGTGSLNSSTTRAFPIPRMELPAGAGVREVARRLAVETSPRYAPKVEDGAIVSTYCNIYATDVAYQLGIYLPRVWWNDPDQATPETRARYGENVHEVNANGLHEWLKFYGQVFGWVRISDLSALQTMANSGALACITGRRVDPSRPGHISIVLPEAENSPAVRAQGVVRIPLQSQAGKQNHECSTAPGAWWVNKEGIPAKWQDYGFWYHPTTKDKTI